HRLPTLLEVGQLQRAKYGAIDAHAPERFPVQIVALHAEQLLDSKEQRTLEHSSVADERNGLPRRHGTDSPDITDPGIAAPASAAKRTSRNPSMSRKNG